jgi:carbonic anhydrase
MFFNEVLARNEAFRKGRRPQPLPPAQVRQLAVLACYDPRLDELIRPSLGLAMGEAILVRSAGARIGPTGDPIRSLALAVYLFDVREVLVLGHKACRLAQFDSLQFVNSFRGRGVARDAFGAEDLRVWAGALASPEQGVRDAVTVLRSAPFLPRDLVVSGFVLDEETGAVDLVVRPDEAVAAATPAPPAHASEAGHGEPPPQPAPHAHAAPRKERAPGQAPPPLPGGHVPDVALTDGMEALSAFLDEVEQVSVWRGALRQLRSDLAREHHPVARLRLVESFMRRAGSDARHARESFEHLRNAAVAGHHAVTVDSLVSLFGGQKDREEP